LLRETLERLGKLNMMAMMVPEAYGGAGKDRVSHVVCLIELAQAFPRAAAVMAANHAFYCFPLLTYGSHEQKNVYLKPCTTGVKIGCYAFAEDEAGPEPPDIGTKAVKNSRGWLIKGRKRFVSQGHIASYGIVLSLAAEEKRDEKPSSIVMGLGKSEGLKVGRVEESLDILAFRNAELSFESVQLPQDALLGNLGEGMGHMKSIQTESWIGIAALAAGVGRAVLQKALNRVAKGPPSGRRVSPEQAVQWKLADMATELDAAELLTLRAAWLRDREKSCEKEVAMARIFASDAAMRTSTQGVQIMGGCGGEPGLEAYMKDAKMCQLSMGTNELATALVAGNLTKGK
jgi:alkylation response protein AidB-like acyl-CoA dehydrogenase